MTPIERSRLLESLIDGDISDADFLRIEAELSVDGLVREEYYNRLKLELLLQRESKEEHHILCELSARGHNEQDNTRRKTKTLLMRTGLLATLAASIALVVYMFTTPESNPQQIGEQINSAPTEQESTATGFALLVGQSDALWEGTSLANGSLIPAGELHLKSGLAQLELFSGVQMVIEGDAVFSVDSAMQINLIRGRASASVPEAAHGFRVKTSQGDVIDLGTEFALDVSGIRSRVEVLNGEIELQPSGSDAQRLTQGESIELSNDGETTNSQVAKLEMISPEAFHRQLASRKSEQHESWKTHTQSMSQDDRLLAYYLVNPNRSLSRQLPNLAAGDPSPATGAGAIVACERASNRWGTPGGALDFGRMGSRIRVDIAGEHRGLTLLCWVKINSLNRRYNSLFLTDGHELNEPHWQILDDGRIFFSVKKFDRVLFSADGNRVKRDVKHNFYSPVIWDPAHAGQWMMLATVYDVDQKSVTHYVNGTSVSQEIVPDEFLVDFVKIGPASIANWNEPMYSTDPEFAVRNLNGSIDEFAIFSGALTEGEVAEHYRIGNPNW